MLIVLLFGILSVNIETAYGQLLIQDKDTCICYTDNQDKRALECLQNKSKRDSLLKNCNLRVENVLSRLSESKGREIILNKNISELNKTILKERKRLKFSLSLNKYGLPISLGGGILIGLIINK